MSEAWEAIVKSGRKLRGILVAIVRMNQARAARLVINIAESSECDVQSSRFQLWCLQA